MWNYFPFVFAITEAFIFLFIVFTTIFCVSAFKTRVLHQFHEIFAVLTSGIFFINGFKGSEAMILPSCFTSSGWPYC